MEAKTCVNLEEWIDVWGTLVGKARKLDDFPMWLQYYPKILFDVINRAGGSLDMYLVLLVRRYCSLIRCLHHKGIAC